MACKQQKFPGKLVVIEFAIGCPDVLPTAQQWRRLGSMRTKDYTLTWDMADATDDSSVGSVREDLAMFLAVALSGDGTVRNDGGAYAKTVVDLEKHVSNPVETGGQPSAWFRITDPRLTRTVYMNIGEFQPLSAPYDDITTWSFSATATASDFGLIVEDTPDPDAPDVTSVTVTPATLELEVGQSDALEATVLPALAPQGIVWSSSNSTVATVNSVSGLVTANTEGTATITATSTADSSKSADCVLTVVL